MTSPTPQTLDQLIAYLGSNPATVDLAGQIDQVVCCRRRSAQPQAEGPARPRTPIGTEGRGR